jgi:hypothetical protein
MGKNVYLHIKNQYRYFLFLLCLFVIPLALFLKYSVYKVPKIDYAVLGALIISQYFLYKEKLFRKKVQPKIVSQLERELKRTPSNKEIYARFHLISHGRKMAIAFASVIILMMIVFMDSA